MRQRGGRSTLWLGACLTLGSFACEDEVDLAISEAEQCFEGRDGRRFCIDVYEASRVDATRTDPGASNEPPVSVADRLPWNLVTWEAARNACQAKGKRLCEREEWQDACDGTVGDGGLQYPYGDELDPSACNVMGGGARPGGSFTRCISPREIFDMSGNVWEWTGNQEADAVARGGAWSNSVVHECRSGEPFRMFDPNLPNEEVGFRCCRDP